MIKKGHQLDQVSICVSRSIWLVSPVVMQGGSPHDRSSVLFLCHESKTEVRPSPQHSSKHFHCYQLPGNTHLHKLHQPFQKTISDNLQVFFSIYGILTKSPFLGNFQNLHVMCCQIDWKSQIAEND